MDSAVGFLRRNAVLLLLANVALGLHSFAADPTRVDRYYAGWLYPRLSLLLRIGFGWIPFSIGDCLYLLFTFALGVLLIRVLVRWWRRQPALASGWLRSALLWLLGIHLSFNLLWGLNYDRSAITQCLAIEPMDSDTALLPALTEALLQKANAFAPAGQRSRVSTEALLSKALSGYAQAESYYPALQTPRPSFKSSLFGSLGNYLGYSGYYNPFTGEGQLNDAIPSILHPFVTCHELAHQIGFARENEANLAGFLAARASADSAFLYSAYLEMFLYASRNLYAMDSSAARSCYRRLSPVVQQDIRDLQAFQARYRTVIDEATDWLYDKYLRLNGQQEGIRSYSSVIVWLLSIYRQDGCI